MRSRSHPATQMLVSEKERDDLLSTSLVAITRNTRRAGEVPVQWLVGGAAGGRDTHAHSECGLRSASATFTGWARGVRSLPLSLRDGTPTRGLLHFELLRTSSWPQIERKAPR